MEVVDWTARDTMVELGIFRASGQRMVEGIQAASTSSVVGGEGANDSFSGQSQSLNGSNDWDDSNDRESMMQ